MPPSSGTSAPHHQAGEPSRSKTMRTKPYTATLVMTPLISAETCVGAAGCASGSQTCSGTSPALEPAPISASTSTTAEIAAEGAGKQAEREQQGERAEARHEKVQVSCSRVAGAAMVRHDQRPGRERH